MAEFEIQVRVRYADTDQMGVMYYANYLILFEMARTEFLRKIGLPYVKLEERGLYLPVAECYCKYRSPAYYDDLLIVKTCLEKISFVRMKFSYTIFKENNILIAEGYTTLCFTDKNHKIMKIPDDIKRVIEEKQ